MIRWALSQIGYGPGVVLYTIFGALAGYSGWQIWQMFLRLDSAYYPMKAFGDIAFRVYGTSEMFSAIFTICVTSI